MYRLLIAVKRGKLEYENTYRWYSRKDENEIIQVIEFETLEEAYEEVKNLMKDPHPSADYSYHDLVVIRYEDYDIEINGEEPSV